jgi:hypothetical protein
MPGGEPIVGSDMAEPLSAALTDDEFIGLSHQALRKPRLKRTADLLPESTGVVDELCTAGRRKAFSDVLACRA